MTKKRRKFSADQKVAFIRKHLIEKIPVSDICDEFKINPTQFYKWQSEFFENGAKAFLKDSKRSLKKSEEQTQQLKADVTQKNNVIAELVEENIKLKKQRGLI